MMALTFKGRMVMIDDHEWEAEYPILAAREVQGLVCLIFDFMAFPNHRQAQNLRAYTPDGHSVWTAEHPTNETADCYTGFIESRTLGAYNFAGFNCELDPLTGKLQKAVFTK
jgi:hypothetical protein